MRGRLATVLLLAPPDIFVPTLVTHPKKLTPEKRGDIEGSVFNLEAVTAKKCDEEGKSVVNDYVSTGRTYTTRTLQHDGRERKRL